MTEALSKAERLPYPAYIKKKIEIWDLINNHVKEYLDVYYPNNTSFLCDDKIYNWYRILDQCIPNGVKYYAYELSKPNLQALLTSFIYTSAIDRQELSDNFQLSNGIWHNLIPTQVPLDTTQRPSVGVLHQYFKLISQITPAYPKIGDDFSAIALDRAGQNKMIKFQHQALILK